MKTKFPSFASAIFLPVSGLVLLLATGFSQTAPSPPAASATAAVELSPFVVETGRDRGYQATNAISATRLNTPVVELPFAVSIATEEFIRDLGTSDLQETMRFLTNTERDFGPNTTGQFNMRGSAMLNRGVFVNSRQSGNGVADTYNIARVEVVKGPASPIVGVTTPVGLINYLIKKPIPGGAFTQVDARIGSDDFRRATFDMNLPFTLAGRAAGVRVLGVGEESGSFIPFVSKRHKGVTVSTLLPLLKTLSVDAYVEYLEVDRNQPGVLAQAGVGHVGARAPFGRGGFDPQIRDINGALIPLRAPVVIGGQTFSTGMEVKDAYDLRRLSGIAGPDNFQNFRTFALDGSLVWQPVPIFNLELFYSASREFKDDMRKEGTDTLRFSGVRVVGGAAVFDPAGGRFFQRHQMFHLPQPAVWRKYARLAAFYDWKLPFMRQMFRAGADSSWMIGRRQNQSRITVGGNRGNVLGLDTFVDEVSFDTTSIARWYNAGGILTPLQHTWLPDEFADSIYATAQGSYWKNRIRTVFGVRRDKLRIRAYQIYAVPQGGSFANDPKIKISDTSYPANSPVASISFEPVRGISVYFNQSESISFTQAGAPVLNYVGTLADNAATAIAQGRFDPATAQGAPPPPETGEGQEYGAKVSLFGGRLSASLAYYENERVNIRTLWPATYIRDLFPAGHPLATQQFSALGVVQESSGWEVEIQSTPVENLSFALGYSEPKVKFTSNPISPTTVGALSAGTFRRTANALGRYAFTRGPLRGAYAGASAMHRGPWRESTTFGGVFLRSYTVVNPFIGYDWRPARRWSSGVRLDVRNVFDREYATRHVIGEPFGFFLSAQLRFK
jgi:outer membrane receptor protein involved in Fe transport